MTKTNICGLSDGVTARPETASLTADPETASLTAWPATAGVARLIRLMWETQPVSCLNPAPFLKGFMKTSAGRAFNDGKQHDSLDFLNVLMVALHGNALQVCFNS